MPPSEEPTPQDPAPQEAIPITPGTARRHYWNEMADLTMSIWSEDRGDDALFRDRLRRYNHKGMRTFTETFPPEQYPGIIEGQAPGVVDRFDTIATEMRDAFLADTLTITRVQEVAAEMRQLCT